MQAGLRWHALGACKSNAAAVALHAVQPAQALNQRADLRLQGTAIAQRVRRIWKVGEGMQDRPNTSGK